MGIHTQHENTPKDSSTHLSFERIAGELFAIVVQANLQRFGICHSTHTKGFAALTELKQCVGLQIVSISSLVSQDHSDRIHTCNIIVWSLVSPSRLVCSVVK